MEVACALRGAPGRLERSAAEGREVEAEAVGLREDAPRIDSRAWDESSERRFFRSGTAMASLFKGDDVFRVAVFGDLDVGRG